MKFGSLTWLIITAALRFGNGAADCPLDHAFLSGIDTGSINPARMESIAGLASGRTTANVLWAHNSGAVNRIFALDLGPRPIDDYTLDRTLIDAQDIAVGPGATAGSHMIYLGDIGGVRSSAVIARFAEPVVNVAPHPNGIIPAPAQSYFTVNYPDGSHDARGLMIDPIANQIFVVTHEPEVARVYGIGVEAMAAGNGTFALIATLPLGSVTAADISPDGTKIAVRNLSTGLMWVRTPSATIADALAKAPIGVPILDGFENNGNSLAFAADEGGYYTTGQGQDPPLHFFARNGSAFTTGIGIATVEHEAFTEISGVASSRRNPGLLWMHNDGSPDYTFLVATNGEVMATYAFATAIDDYEDIAVGPGPVAGKHYVYAGEIGDNSAARTEIRVFRFEEPRVTQRIDGVAAADETVITLQYPDGAHDAEALLVDPESGDLFVISKENNAFRAYKATQAQLNSGAVVPLTLAQSGNFGPVSGGDISPDGSMIALRHEDGARLWHRPAGESVEMALGRPPLVIPVVGRPIEPNGEGLTFTPDSRGYFTVSEGVLPVIYLFDRLAQPAVSTMPQVTPQGVRVFVSGCEGSRIRLEASNELTTWAPVGAGFVASGVATIDSAGGATKRFYRAVVDGP